MSDLSSLNNIRTVLFDSLSWLDFVLGNRNVYDEHVVKTLENLSSSGNALLSVVSLWEITKLVQKGQFTTTILYKQWLDQAIGQSNTQLVQLELPIIIEAGSLPGDAEDLSDNERLLAATARTHKALLITKQENLIDYSSQKFLDVFALEEEF